MLQSFCSPTLYGTAVHAPVRGLMPKTASCVKQWLLPRTTYRCDVRANPTSKHVCCAGRLLAVALLDCTVKVFFLDSLKFFLSLYGHKLPVSTCISFIYSCHFPLCVGST